MIYAGEHRVTGLKQTVAECDHEDCAESYYLPNNGNRAGAEWMQNLGWHAAPQPGDVDYTSLCPTHAQGLSIQHEHRYRTEYGYNGAMCTYCGRKRPGTS